MGSSNTQNQPPQLLNIYQHGGQGRWQSLLSRKRGIKEQASVYAWANQMGEPNR